MAAGALHRRRRGERPRSRSARGHDPERHHQGVPGPRDLRLPARPLDAPDRRHGGLHGRGRPALEPDQHLLLSPAGGGGHARAGDRLRDGQRHRGPRRRARTRRRGPHGQGLRADLLLRQRRRALRRGARQAARDGRAVGGARPRALRRAGPQAPALPLRRAGQLARPDRVPAREQRPAHRARGARGHPRPRRAGAGDPAAGVERGARAAAPVGPAVVAAHPAGAGLRDRPARVPRPLRGLQGDGRARGRAAGGRARRDGDRRRARRRGRRGGLHEGGARRLPQRAHPPHRGGRPGHRRRQPLHREPSPRRCWPGPTAASSPSIRRPRHSSARRWCSGAPSATRPRSTRRW